MCKITKKALNGESRKLKLAPRNGPEGAERRLRGAGGVPRGGRRGAERRPKGVREAAGGPGVAGGQIK